MGVWGQALKRWNARGPQWVGMWVPARTPPPGERSSEGGAYFNCEEPKFLWTPKRKKKLRCNIADGKRSFFLAARINFRASGVAFMLRYEILAYFGAY